MNPRIEETESTIKQLKNPKSRIK